MAVESLNVVSVHSYSAAEIAGLHREVLGLVPDREKAIAAESEKQASREALRHRWADSAQEVETWANGETAKLQAMAEHDTNTTLEDQMAHVKSIQGDIEAYYGSTFPQLEALSKDMEEAVILDNPYTILTMDILRNKYFKLTQETVSMISSFENQVRRGMLSMLVNRKLTRVCSRTDYDSRRH